MKTFIGILLIGLMGFLGCSDSGDTTRTVDQATPVAPWAIIETSTPTYEWTPVKYAAKYRLIVQDTNQESTTQDTTESYIIDEWYTAEEAGCASEDGLCMVTPDIEVFEENTWRVQACAYQQCGLWSDALNFSVPGDEFNEDRWTDNGDDTVTDRNTHLMWPKNADLFGLRTWSVARGMCQRLNLSGYTDWRLPRMKERMYFRHPIDAEDWGKATCPIDENHMYNAQNDYYWLDANEGSACCGRVWVVNICTVVTGFEYASITYRTLCVREARQHE